jgi:hypothetical protein
MPPAKNTLLPAISQLTDDLAILRLAFDMLLVVRSRMSTTSVTPFSKIPPAKKTCLSPTATPILPLANDKLFLVVAFDTIS